MSFINDLSRKYRGKGLLLDANILLLLLIGRCDRSLISRFKRTRIFTADDFDLLASFVDWFDRIVTTPCVLAEVNGMANQLTQESKTEVYSAFAIEFGFLDETHQPSAQVAAHQRFPSIGLTDAGILMLAKDRYLVVTDDFRLSQVLEHEGIDVINFNHIRDMWDE